jgi:hypothetical protein
MKRSLTPCRFARTKGVNTMTFLHLVCVLLVGLSLCAAQEPAQVPTTAPELIEGPWEITAASGIDGIF